MHFTKRINSARRNTAGKRAPSIMRQGKKKTTLPTSDNWAREHSNELMRRGRSSGRKRGSKAAPENVILNAFFDNQGDDWVEVQSVEYFEDGGNNYVHKSGLGGLNMHQLNSLEIGKNYRLITEILTESSPTTSGNVNFYAATNLTEFIGQVFGLSPIGIYEFDFTAGGTALTITAVHGNDWINSVQVFPR